MHDRAVACTAKISTKSPYFGSEEIEKRDLVGLEELRF